MFRRQTISLALAAVLGMLTPAFAAEDSPAEGTWTVNVTPAFAPAGFPNSFTALETYSGGGGMVTSNALPPVPRPGQGAWQKNASGYNVKIVFLGVQIGGATPGMVKIDHRFTLTAKDQYTGEGSATFFDGNGNLLFSLPFTSQGRRLAVP